MIVDGDGLSIQAEEFEYEQTAEDFLSFLPINLTITRQDDSFFIVNDLDKNKQHVFYSVEELLNFIQRYE